MNHILETPHEVRISAGSKPEKVGVHMYELIRSNSSKIVVVCIGMVAIQQGLHSVVSLNMKLAPSGRQALLYPTYKVIKGHSGGDRTVMEFNLVLRKVSFDVQA